MSNEWRFPAPFQRQTYDPNGLFNNPAQTLPLPTPTAPPVGVWIGAREPISWINNGAGEYVATWGSPVFDLRPSLRGLVERTQNPNSQGATPVWVASGVGSGGKLFVQIDDLLSNVGASQTPGVEIYAQEFAAIADVGHLNSVTPQTNITLNIVNGSSFGCAIAPFTPRGEGYPVRYWQIRLEFRRKTSFGVPYPFPVQGAYY
jgi:hypothetical protein